MKEIDKDPIYISILNIIYRHGKAYPDVIASKLGVSRQAVDYRLKRLLDAGYIEKRYNRKVYYVITDSGLNIVSGKPVGISEIKDRDKSGNMLKYVPILGVSMGIITLGQFIAMGDPLRGIIGFISWTFIGIVGYYYLKNKFG